MSNRVLHGLDNYVDLLDRWRRVTNLISDHDFAEVWTRHVADSAQLLTFAPTAASWLDIGTGAGFPGAIIAILLAEVPGAIVHCVESDKRKCAFLRQVARRTAAPLHVHAYRMEPALSETFRSVHAVTARGLTTLTELINLSRFVIERGAVGIFPRGQVNYDEINELTSREAFRIEVASSRFDRTSSVLLISRLPKVPS